MDDPTKETDVDSIWIRLLYMILFVIIFGVVEFVLYLTALVGFIFRLLGKSDHDKIRYVGRCLGMYVKEIADYLTFNSEVRPFPFSDWPESKSM